MKRKPGASWTHHAYARVPLRPLRRVWLDDQVACDWVRDTFREYP